MASIAEFYSANLSTEILKGSVEKAKAGGTPFRAPIGYVNVRRWDDGRESRTVELDPDRAPLVAWAFEVYATDDYSLLSLVRELTAKGLNNRASGEKPERPMHLSKLYEMLTNSYYVGIVTYRGVQYPGKHPALVTPDVFDQVQAILAAHNLSGERLIRHAHYLKGTVFCARCGSRLSVCNFNGNGGTYMYFFCLGRHHRNGCHLPYLDVDQLEELVANRWRSKQLPAELVETIRRNLTADLDKQRTRATKLIDAARRKIEKIKRDRVVWATKSADGVIPDDIGRAKQNELTQQLVRAEHDLAKLEQATEDITGVIHAALDLIGDCGQADAAAGPMLRRDWIQSFFGGIDVDVDRVTKSTLKAPFETLMDPSVIAHYQRPAPIPVVQTPRRPPEGALPKVHHDTHRVLVGVGVERRFIWLGWTGCR